MQACIFQESNFQGNVELSFQYRHSFYRYSLWRTSSGEHLFDGAAGDLAEAMETMRAHVQFLSAEGGIAAGE